MSAPNGAANSSAKPTERTTVITREFDAPRALVFKAWTDANQLKQWWGPKHFTNPVCETDPRVGGAWRIVMRGPDGTDYPCHGVYTEVREPETLAFTNIATDAEGKPILEGVTRVTFTERSGRTTMTMESRAKALVAYATAHLEGMETGWIQSIDRLSAFLPKA